MILKASDLRHSYGKIESLRGLSFEIEKAGVVALLGPNGAGKSTLSRILSGVLTPTAGHLELMGCPSHSIEARRRVGITPQEVDFPKHLRVEEILNLVRSHYDNSRPLEALLESFQLQGLRRRYASELSGGQKRRLAVACTFAGPAKLVVLDEPTTGLDIESRRVLWENVREFSRHGGSVLLTTHYLDEVEALAGRVLVLHQGQLLYDGGVQELKSRIGFRRVRFQSEDFEGKLGGYQFERASNDFQLVCPDSDVVVRLLIDKSVPFKNLEVTSVSLEDAFLALVQRDSKL